MLIMFLAFIAPLGFTKSRLLRSEPSMASSQSITILYLESPYCLSPLSYPLEAVLIILYNSASI